MQNNLKTEIEKFIKKEKVVTLDQIKAEVKSGVTMTIMRKLKSLGYLTSYSDRGKYYTLIYIPKFSDLGLWSFNDSIHFSKYNTLVDTCYYFINESISGQSIRELESLLKVTVRLAVGNLYKEQKVFRASFNGELVFFSIDNKIRKAQMALRNSAVDSLVFSNESLTSTLITNELKAAVILFYSSLNEQQRRLYAGLESIKYGHGGDKVIAELLQIHPETVSKGRHQLVEANLDLERIRKPGGGRHEVKKNTRSDPEN